MHDAPGLSSRNAEARSGVPESVEVRAKARLHFGFLDPSGRGARAFAGLGLGLDRPETRVIVGRAEAFAASGPDAERAERYARRLADDFAPGAAFSVEVVSAIPPHAGLGSGTQLALAVGAGLSRITGTGVSAAQIAAALDRGRRSGVGIATFAAGGLIVDGGKGPGSKVPPAISRLDFPAGWRVLMIFDDRTVGIHGREEVSAFDTLPDFPQTKSADLAYRLVTRLLPAIAEAGFAPAAEEIREFQRVMGDHFAPVQGGPYTSTAVAEALTWLEGRGLTGFGQSSWGPTGFALVESEPEAQNLLAGLEARWPQTSGLRFDIARGSNRGAEIIARPRDDTKRATARDQG